MPDGLKGRPDKRKLVLFSSSSKLGREGKGGEIGQCHRKFLRSPLRATAEPFATEIASGGDKNVNQSKVGCCKCSIKLCLVEGRYSKWFNSVKRGVLDLFLHIYDIQCDFLQKSEITKKSAKNDSLNRDLLKLLNRYGI